LQKHFGEGPLRREKQYITPVHEKLELKLQVRQNRVFRKDGHAE